MKSRKSFSVFVYEVRKQDRAIATFCIEDDANAFAESTGGTVYKIGAY